MDLKDLTRQVLNEINVGGKQIDNENDEDSDNFMDDDDNDQQQDDTSTDNDTEATDDTGTDDDDVGAGESDNFMDDGDDSEGDGEEGAEDDGSGESDDVGEGESDNFMDDGDGSEGDGEEDTGEGGEEGESSEEGDENGEDDEYDIEKIENELFSDLTPEQIAIKNHELKNQFIETYSIIGSTLVRINDIPKSNDNVNILKFVTEKLLELRDMIDYNITVAYPTRTYIENNIIYQQCIATLNAIADIIDNIPNVNGGESNADAEEEDKEKDLGEPVEPDENEEQKQLDISDINTASDYQEESAHYGSNSSDYNDLF